MARNFEVTKETETGRVSRRAMVLLSRHSKKENAEQSARRQRKRKTEKNEKESEVGSCSHATHK